LRNIFRSLKPCLPQGCLFARPCIAYE
jgi:hypothetical protein